MTSVVLCGEILCHLLHDTGGLARLDAVVVDANNDGWKDGRELSMVDAIINWGPLLYYDRYFT